MKTKKTKKTEPLVEQTTVPSVEDLLGAAEQYLQTMFKVVRRESTERQNDPLTAAWWLACTLDYFHCGMQQAQWLPGCSRDTLHRAENVAMLEASVRWIRLTGQVPGFDELADPAPREAIDEDVPF